MSDLVTPPLRRNVRSWTTLPDSVVLRQPFAGPGVRSDLATTSGTGRQVKGKACSEFPEKTIPQKQDNFSRTGRALVEPEPAIGNRTSRFALIQQGFRSCEFGVCRRTIELQITHSAALNRKFWRHVVTQPTATVSAGTSASCAALESATRSVRVTAAAGRCACTRS